MLRSCLPPDKPLVLVAEGPPCQKCVLILQLHRSDRCPVLVPSDARPAQSSESGRTGTYPKQVQVEDSLEVQQ